MIFSNSFTICLETPPIVVNMAPAIHGHKVVESWLLPEVYSLHLYQYRARIRVGTETLELEPGAVTLIGPSTPITYQFPGPGCRHHYALFSTKKGDKGESFDPFRRPHELTAAWRTGFVEAAEAFAGNRAFATARLWDLLWRYTGRSAAAPSDLPPLVAEAIDRMHRHLHQEIRMAFLAQDLGVSQNLLMLRFRQSMGTSPHAWLKAARMARARTMLTETPLPVKIVARECGYHDLHAFNKAVREAWGKSPRGMRGDGDSGGS